MTIQTLRMKNDGPQRKRLFAISKTSGVAEILKNILKVDFWDTNELANQIANVMKYDSLRTTLRDNALHEAEEYTWNTTARKTLLVYESLLKPHGKELLHA